ncbi:GTPase IMAP family member 7 [Danio aesculapii]|uniref:GTPase IMAP family member 7 n=1 Tax=Danio aesculapii TaxID=1142201 RepID=UPI0024C002B0|nr:GTPase IMAP family member 7 [Danio aesculapii]XP_056310133.1 GTPase IMAP family member 7 [Danio aesculapii]XP_056310134.1 GTPase IMAP family member 7 [Danio aesculapii]XP_056310135.1 GTPase IMAP family member 7 [Danio aesculapii]
MATVKEKPRRRDSLDRPPNMSSETSLRMLIFGSSSHVQISTSQSILGQDVFSRFKVNISATKKSSGVFQERKTTLINTPNLQDNRGLPDRVLQKELRKAVCCSCPGPHAVLLILDALHLTADATDILKPVVHYFGEHVLKHILIVLYHKKNLRALSIEDEVKRNKSFSELAEKCGNNYLFFNEEINQTHEGSQTQALFTKIDEMVLEHGVYSNLEFKDAEKRIHIEERFIRKSREKEIRQTMEMLEKKHSGEALAREMKNYEDKIQMECREKAELAVADKIGFTLRVVDYAVAVGKGAFVGALLGFAVGNEGMAIGAAIGAGLGGVLGGAVNAAWSYISSSFPDALRDST